LLVSFLALPPPPVDSCSTVVLLLAAAEEEEAPTLLDAAPDAPPLPPLAFLLALRLDAATMTSDGDDATS
jgi:hypothetical protein